MLSQLVAMGTVKLLMGKHPIQVSVYYLGH